MKMTTLHDAHGFTLIEVLITLVVMALLLSVLTTSTNTMFRIHDRAAAGEQLAHDASLAMSRLTTAVVESPGLLLPLPDNPSTPQNEALRDQRVPPEPGKEKHSAVLAVRLSPHIDRDKDGIADADNDGDGRIDEDPGPDRHNDSASGIRGIDDNQDGIIDDEDPRDDDEDGKDDEDSMFPGDQDGDRAADEDASADFNGDGFPGVAGKDDDGDGLTDEGTVADDDEDGQVNEDWYDVVVYYLDGNKLIERQPLPYDLNGNGSITGRDYSEVVLAEGVSFFRVERIERARAILVDLTLELSSDDGQQISLNTQVRLGGGA